MKQLKTVSCSKCGGTGQVPAPDTGALLKAERLRLGITRQAVADAMGISTKYLSDLEEDQRKVWAAEKVTAYLAALNGGK